MGRLRVGAGVACARSPGNVAAVEPPLIVEWGTTGGGDCESRTAAGDDGLALRLKRDGRRQQLLRHQHQMRWRRPRLRYPGLSAVWSQFGEHVEEAADQVAP